MNDKLLITGMKLCNTDLAYQLQTETVNCFYSAIGENLDVFIDWVNSLSLDNQKAVIHYCNIRMQILEFYLQKVQNETFIDFVKSNHNYVWTTKCGMSFCNHTILDEMATAYLFDPDIVFGSGLCDWR